MQRGMLGAGTTLRRALLDPLIAGVALFRKSHAVAEAATQATAVVGIAMDAPSGGDEQHSDSSSDQPPVADSNSSPSASEKYHASSVPPASVSAMHPLQQRLKHSRSGDSSGGRSSSNGSSFTPLLGPEAYSGRGIDVYLLHFSPPYSSSSASSAGGGCGGGGARGSTSKQSVADLLHVAFAARISTTSPAPASAAAPPPPYPGAGARGVSLVLPDGGAEDDLVTEAAPISAEWQQVLLNLCASWAQKQLPARAVEAVQKHTCLVYFHTAISDSSNSENNAYLVSPLKVCGVTVMYTTSERLQ